MNKKKSIGKCKSDHWATEKDTAIQPIVDIKIDFWKKKNDDSYLDLDLFADWRNGIRGEKRDQQESFLILDSTFELIHF